MDFIENVLNQYRILFAQKRDSLLRAWEDRINTFMERQVCESYISQNENIEITDEEELISMSVAFLPVLQIHHRCGTNVFCFDSYHVKDRRKDNKTQILTCEIVDSTETYLMLGCCVGFLENTENYGSLIDCIKFCGLNLNQGDFIMMSDSLMTSDSVLFQKLNKMKKRDCIQQLISNVKNNGIALTEEDENLISTQQRRLQFLNTMPLLKGWHEVTSRQRITWIPQKINVGAPSFF